MATEVGVFELPACDFCKPVVRPAHYDGKTTTGPWAYMCNAHFSKYGMGLGTGVGQRLILIESKDDK